MDLYKSSLCWYDYIEVRDGYWRKSALLGKGLRTSGVAMRVDKQPTLLRVILELKFHVTNILFFIILFKATTKIFTDR